MTQIPTEQASPAAPTFAYPELTTFLVKAGLADSGETINATPLSGGVSSEIWHVTTGRGAFCVKRALGTLKVKENWEAPVERNAHEWAYFVAVDKISPGNVPKPIAHDEEAGFLAMEWLPPEEFRLWKSDLLAGRVNPEDGARIGALLGKIHSATARQEQFARDFKNDATFHALRIEPFFLFTAARHPDLADFIHPVAEQTAKVHLALVHGDASPKNILFAGKRAVLLDAETACFGDPAFDVAFCLNHIMIKGRVVNGASAALDQLFHQFSKAYLSAVDWELPSELERRAAQILPILALARVDGKSPVEYLDEPQRAALRHAARHLIRHMPSTLSAALPILKS